MNNKVLNLDFTDEKLGQTTNATLFTQAKEEISSSETSDSHSKAESSSLEVSDDDPLTQHYCRRYRRRICLVTCLLLATAAALIYVFVFAKGKEDEAPVKAESKEEPKVE